ncbi:MAG: helix-turn-helix transcriptional regulator [Planctomycetota bacterium]
MSFPDARTRTTILAHNLRRVMARNALTYEDVVRATGLDARTVRGILYAEKRPHARTLNRLADGLGVAVDELFTADGAATVGEFDAATNPEIDAAVAARPDLFQGWTPSDYGELASRFGHGGALTREGVCEAAVEMNANRRTIERALIVLETEEANTLRSVVDAMYDRATAEPDGEDAATAEGQ